MDQLEQVLRMGEILEAVPAEVFERDPCRSGTEHPDNRRRHEHLPAVSGRHDPRCPVHYRPVVIAGPGLGVAAVDPHANPKRSSLRPFRLRQGELGLQ